ncbi:MAG: hypothetical protein QW175_07645 [Candidatus Bathyarchaeia archaeon]
MSKRHREIADYYLQTLAQQVARKYPYLTDYACNVYADKLAQLDVIIELADDPEEKEVLETVRKIVKRQGEALWFMQAGELTNLGLKLGSSLREALWNPGQ